jgi:hypothetical protein
MYPYSFKEDLGSGLCCDALLAGGHNHHLRKSINNHKNIVIFPLGGREARHAIHVDGFALPVKSRKRGVHALFLSGRFGNSASSAGPDVLPDLLSKFQLVEMFLQHFHCLFDVEVSCHPTVVGFPDQIHSFS